MPFSDMDALAAYGSKSEDELIEYAHGTANSVPSQGSAAVASKAAAAARADCAPPAKKARTMARSTRNTASAVEQARLPDPLLLLSGAVSQTHDIGKRRHETPAQQQQQSLRHPAHMEQAAQHQLSQHPPEDKNEPPQRIRSFPHVEGNYATLVYIKLPQHQAVRQLFQGLLAALPTGDGLPELHPIDGLQLGGGPISKHRWAPDPLPPHISLSRTVAVRLEQSRPLLASLTRQLRGSRARPKALGLRGLRVLPNDDRTRTFVALTVESGADQVCKLIAAVNAAFAEHGLPAFYEDPQPHASFAWALGDHEVALTEALSDHNLGHDIPKEPLEVPVAQVVCRVGQRENVVWSATG